MPAKDYNNYMKNYMLKRYHIRRNNLIIILGGQCIKCGSKENLELDHINPKDKVISWKYLAGMSSKKLESEILKCQLLCKPCHIVKTVTERGQLLAAGTHGTLAAKKYCGPPACRECKNAYNIWNNKHRAGNSEARVPSS